MSNPWLRQEIYAHARGRNPLQAARLGNLEAFKCGGMDMTGIEPIDVLTQAVFGGHVELIFYIYENVAGLKGYSAHAVDMAANNGLLDVVKYFHNKGERPSARTMVEASRRGRLEVVKWLHEHYYSDISEVYEYSMKCAIGEGKLDVVKWFHENDVKYNNTFHIPIGQAIRRNYIEVVKYLNENYDISCNEDDFEEPIIDDNVEMVQYICENMVVYRYNHKVIEDYSRKHRFAVQCESWEVAEYMREFLSKRKP